MGREAAIASSARLTGLETGMFGIDLAVHYAALLFPEHELRKQTF